MNERLPAEQVIVKMSTCSKCNGFVRAAVEHMMDNKDKKDFLKEVMKYNLNVSHVPLLEYKKNEYEWCQCNKKK